MFVWIFVEIFVKISVEISVEIPVEIFVEIFVKIYIEIFVQIVNFGPPRHVKDSPCQILRITLLSFKLVEPCQGLIHVLLYLVTPILDYPAIFRTHPAKSEGSPCPVLYW